MSTKNMGANKLHISETTKNEAQAIAKATQKPGQTKEQTKLIRLGIEKGIAEYKKQQKIKKRSSDKQYKKQQKSKQLSESVLSEEVIAPTNKRPSFLQLLPWGLLVISWLFFFILKFYEHSLY